MPFRLFLMVNTLNILLPAEGNVKDIFCLSWSGLAWARPWWSWIWAAVFGFWPSVCCRWSESLPDPFWAQLLTLSCLTRTDRSRWDSSQLQSQYCFLCSVYKEASFPMCLDLKPLIQASFISPLYCSSVSSIIISRFKIFNIKI